MLLPKLALTTPLLSLSLVLLMGCGSEPAPAMSEDEFARTRPFIDQDYYVADPVIGHAHPPGAFRELDWEEHPAGRIEMATNNLGLRRDRDVEPRRPAGVRRILISGDSHIDGVVWNRESIAHRLENALESAASPGEVEVLNAGVGYYGPLNYGRLMQRYGELDPDLIVVILFMGNDLLDAARVLEATTDLGSPRSSRYYDAIEALRQQTGEAVSQGLNQIYYFTRFPDMLPPSIDYTVARLETLAEECRARGADLLVLLLPTKLDVEEGALDGLRLAAARALGPDAASLRLNRQLTARVLRRLQSAGVEAHDLFGDLRGLGRPLYWQRDHHLSADGHAAVADSLMRHYGSRLQERVTASQAPSAAPAAP